MQRRKAILLFFGLLAAAGVVLFLTAMGWLNLSALDKVGPQAKKLLFPDGGLALPAVELPDAGWLHPSSPDAGAVAKATPDAGPKLKLAPGEGEPRPEKDPGSSGLLSKAISFAQGTCSLSGRVVLKSDKGPLNPEGRVVVYIETVPPDSWQRDKQSAQVAIRKGHFEPALQAVVKDDTVRFLNPEGGEHSVFSASGANAFSLTQGKQTLLGATTPAYRGAMHLQDDLDESLSADVLVLANPFFTGVTAQGDWKLQGLPSGERNLIVWEPNGGTTSQVVKCSGDLQVPNLTVEPLAPSPRKHRDGKPYR